MPLRRGDGRLGSVQLLDGSRLRSFSDAFRDGSQDERAVGQRVAAPEVALHRARLGIAQVARCTLQEAFVLVTGGDDGVEVLTRSFPTEGKVRVVEGHVRWIQEDGGIPAAARQRVSGDTAVDDFAGEIDKFAPADDTESWVGAGGLNCRVAARRIVAWRRIGARGRVGSQCGGCFSPLVPLSPQVGLGEF